MFTSHSRNPLSKGRCLAGLVRVALCLLPLLALTAWGASGKKGNAVVFHGIDVSRHQGYIDWKSVASDGRVGFVYIRASNGSRTDANYRRNIQQARRHGLLVGSYHCLNPNCPVQAQFNNFRSCVKPGEQDLIPVVDIEDVPELGVLWKPQQARDFLADFAELVQKHYGVKPMIYTSNTFFTDYLGRAFADFPLFIARYGAVEPNPLNGAHWTLWQFTRQGRVSGINHDVDLSRFNKGKGVASIRMAGRKAKPKAKAAKRQKGAAGKNDKQSHKTQKSKKSGKAVSSAKPPKATKSTSSKHRTSAGANQAASSGAKSASGKQNKAKKSASKPQNTQRQNPAKNGKTKRK